MSEKTKPRCSFCGDDADQCDALIQSDIAEPPPAMICENCVSICVDILAGRVARRAVIGQIGVPKRVRDKRGDPPSRLAEAGTVTP